MYALRSCGSTRARFSRVSYAARSTTARRCVLKTRNRRRWMMGNGKWSVAALSMVIFLSGAPTRSGSSKSSAGPPPSWATAVTTQVARRAHRLEKQEGKHNLVKDKIRTTTTATGQTLVEQVGE